MEQKKPVDLADLDTVAASNEGFEMELSHPGTQDSLDIHIRVLGRDSDEYRRVSAEQLRKRVNRMTKGGTFRPAPLSAKEQEAEVVELLAACTMSWRTGDEPVLILGKDAEGNPNKIPFSKAAAKQLYTSHPWVREQVDIAVTDRANFSPR